MAKLSFFTSVIAVFILTPGMAFGAPVANAPAACANISGTYLLGSDSESRSLIRYEQHGCATLASDIVFQQLDPKTSRVVYETPAMTITSVIDGTDDCSKQTPCFAIYQAFPTYMSKKTITPRLHAADSNIPGCRFTESRLSINTSGDLVEQMLPDTCPVNAAEGHALPAVTVYKRFR